MFTVELLSVNNAYLAHLEKGKCEVLEQFNAKRILLKTSINC